MDSMSEQLHIMQFPPESNWVTTIHQVKKKVPTSKQVGKDEIPLNPPPARHNIDRRVPATLCFSLKGKVFRPSRAPIFKIPYLKQEPQCTELWRVSSICVHKTHETIVSKEAVINGWECLLQFYSGAKYRGIRQKRLNTSFSIEGA